MSTIGLSASPRPAVSSVLPAVLVFWLACYALFSYRVQLRGDEGLDALFTLRRLAATGIGALFFGAALHHGRRRGRRAFTMPRLAALIVAASLAMIGFRAFADPFVSTDPEPLATHIRWTLTWAGYFGLALCLAAVAHWRFNVANRGSIATPEHPVPDNLEWLAGALASELPSVEREELADRIEQRGGYRVADDPAGDANLRAEIAGRLAARLRAAA